MGTLNHQAKKIIDVLRLKISSLKVSASELNWLLGSGIDNELYLNINDVLDAIQLPKVVFFTRLQYFLYQIDFKGQHDNDMPIEIQDEIVAKYGIAIVNAANLIWKNPSINDIEVTNFLSLLQLETGRYIAKNKNNN